MPISNGELLNVIQEIAKNANLTVSVNESGNEALIEGTCAFAGGLLGGPRGSAIGSAIGALIAAVQDPGEYKSVSYIIMYEMTAQQRNLLARSMRRVLGALQATRDETMLLIIIMANPSLKSLVLSELGKFLANEMGLTLNM